MITFSIYVIDDEKTIRDGITMTLEADYRIRSFPRAEPAIVALQDDPPDLILLDVGLPGIDGIEALRQIKSSNPDILRLYVQIPGRAAPLCLC